MICPKCHKTYQDDWEFCPTCSCALVSKIENNEEKKNWKKTITVSILAFLALFVIANYMFSGKNTASKQPAKSSARQVLLTAGFSQGFIVIKNENNFDWTNAKIKVANGITDQYSLNVGTIRAGETKQYRLSSFTDFDGKRYNGYEYVPKQVLIYADNASGGKQY